MILLGACADDEQDSGQYVLKTITLGPHGLPHTVHYDDRGLVPEVSNFNNEWIGTTYECDSRGNLISGNNWVFSYDEANRLTHIAVAERNDLLSLQFSTPRRHVHV